MKQPRQVIEQWIESIREDGHGVTKWESDFVDSIAEQVEERGSISEKQQDILERIYCDRT